mmetsp:Transcript_17388/g.22748  ORF Transcript_17388/g.22748 Transcript_17388/m.22748 type:complete len:650 (-) Transcript_17388:606-2555(-)
MLCCFPKMIPTPQQANDRHTWLVLLCFVTFLFLPVTGATNNSEKLLYLSVPSEPASGFGYAGVGSLGEAHEAALEYRRNKQGSLSEKANKFHLKHEKSQSFHSIWPVVSGDWVAGNLSNRWTDGNGVAKETVCGSVFWSKDVIGETIEQAAKIIHEDICMTGACTYNINKETSKFAEVGGRLVNRLTWKFSEDVIRRGLNGELEAESPYKLLQSIMNQSQYGEDLTFAPLNSYWQNSWPHIRDLPGYGTKIFGPNGKLLQHGDTLRVFLPDQEYLAGRILTTEINGIRAAKLLLVFTYSAPLLLEEAYLAGSPIWPLQAEPLRNKASFQVFMVEANDCDIVEALGSVSRAKLYDLFTYLFDDETSDAAKRYISLMYGGDGVPNALRYESVYRIVSDLHGEFSDGVILGLDKAGVLNQVVLEAQERYETSLDKWVNRPPGALLGSVTTMKALNALLDAGIVPTIEDVENAMHQCDIAKKLIETFDFPLDALLVRASRGLHAGVIGYILQKMSGKQLANVFSNSSFRLTKELDSDLEKFSVTLVGTIWEVSAANFALQYFYGQLHNANNNFMYEKRKSKDASLLQVAKLLHGYGMSLKRLKNIVWSELTPKYLPARWKETIDPTKLKLSELLESVDVNPIVPVFAPNLEYC